ncbi:MAG: CHRD domain-containing protein [Cyanobacteria bacterium J083]|nr:MAG: CHRD domain-containing protein [Cyanobacteria bacterium J083]
MNINIANLLITTSVITLGSFNFLASSVQAATIFQATLEGSQEVPPVTTSASGSALLSLDKTTNLFDIQIDVTGISVTELLGVGANSSPLHIHLAPAGSNGNIIVDLGFLGTPVPTSTGFSFTLPNTLFGGTQGNLTSDVATNVASLLAGDTYINIHTNAFPSGELRGQLTPVPEPTAILSLLTLGAIGGWLRRKDKKTPTS